MKKTMLFPGIINRIINRVINRVINRMINRLTNRLKACFAVGLLVFTVGLPTTGVAQENTHFQVTYTNPLAACEFKGNLKINGEDAQPGDEVAFFDPNGVLCGHSVVEVVGRYLFAFVFGDDLTTHNIDEGALSGDELKVKIWDADKQRELSGECVKLYEGTAQGNYIPSSVPPKWQHNGFLILDIDTGKPPADINEDCTIDLFDALLALQIVNGIKNGHPVSNGADVNNNQKIGLQEVIYTLQKLAGMRQ